jgi:hypothetical protein
MDKKTTNSTVMSMVSLDTSSTTTDDSSQVFVIPNEQTFNAGTYWKLLKTDSFKTWTRERLKVGRTYLIVRLHDVENKLHTVELRHHPLEIDDSHSHTFRCLAKDFFQQFEPNLDWKLEREAEIQAINDEVQALQFELVERQRNPMLLLSTLDSDETLDLSVGLPSHDVEESDVLAQSLKLNTTEYTLEKIQKQAQNQRALAEVHSKWIQTQTTKLSSTLTKLSPFYSEQAEATLAACSETLGRAEALLSGVKTLSLYTGKDVEVFQVADGQPAKSSEPLYLFQSRLSMDEEYIIHLAEDGADFTDFASFCQEIQSSPTLLNRILPMERSIVLMNYRRSDKEYHDTWINHANNQLNHSSFLLIRDGQRVWQVFSELVTQGAQRLFPTTDETNQPFRGFRGEKITFNDVRFVNSLAAHQTIALHYKRLLILLCGLQDRLQLLGTFDGGPYAELSMMSQAVQDQLFKFVFDEERVLSDGRPTFYNWTKEKNRYLRAGSKVVAIWKNIMTSSSCPSCVEASHSSSSPEYFRYDPKNSSDIVSVQYSKGRPYVKVPVSGQTQTGSAREFLATVYLDCEAAFGIPYLCLDHVSSVELTYYLADRKTRSQYIAYYELFASARNFLLSAENASQPLRTAVLRALQYSSLTSEQTTAIVDDAFRLWLATYSTKTLPCADSSNFIAVSQQLASLIHSQLEALPSLKPKLEDLAKSLNRNPLRASISGRNQLIFYVEPLATERTEPFTEQVWVKRLVIQRTKTKLSIAAESWTQLTDYITDEQPVINWTGVEKWTDLKLTKLKYLPIIKLREDIEHGVSQLSKILTAPDPEYLEELFTTLTTESLRNSNYIRTIHLHIPIGLIQVPASYYHPELKKTEVLCVVLALDSLLPKIGGASQTSRVCDWVLRTYAQKSAGLKAMNWAPYSLRIAATSLNDYIVNQPYACSAHGQTWSLQDTELSAEFFLKAEFLIQPDFKKLTQLLKPFQVFDEV